ncbi:MULTISPECIES: hypothetical protein [Leptolyngbya]|uniref:hypothetical protein n=1 Tax=Leptolyngbya TaxID=47251 RepID=UPI0016820941|nr:hypothetical protein [Leptolyngbya sp. FACHB-1624]MBD1858649.1 hypothetical protein [Leptolyngbya sp. FACHB-1624]
MMSADQRQQLLKVLYELQLVRRWASSFRLQFLQVVSLDAIAVWTDEFLQAVLEEFAE